MDRIYIKNVARHAGQTVTIKGWLYNKRSSGKLHFLQVRDGTGIVQCVVYQGDVSDDTFKRSGEAQQESSVIVYGTVRKDPRAPIGYEVGVSELEIVQLAEGYPITPKEHGTAFLMDHRHLWLRSSRQHAILRVRSEIVKACRDYYGGGHPADDDVRSPPSVLGDEVLEDRGCYKAHAISCAQQAEDPGFALVKPMRDEGAERSEANQAQPYRNHDAVEKIEMPH